ncbi:MAG: prolyl oligopeptidase family serine peptidase [Gammaproteobacteria bacterium]|nr:prolyl oligopeptidase family serine peptidase [Gammaproteobacteria bacterium]
MPSDTPKTTHDNTAYGQWNSAITTELIVSDSVSIDEARQVGNSLYYIERRPQQAGRSVIVKNTRGISVDILPEPYSANSRVHEYGGGCYCVHHEQIFFVNDSDQDIYLIDNQTVSRITRNKHQRYADFSYDKKFKRLIAICESHLNDSVINEIVAIDICTGNITVLVSGNDFYASPRLNQTSSQICWQTWNHPNMPWDGNQLYLADIDNKGLPLSPTTIAGGENISVFQPQWSMTDVLYYISDDTGWWQLYRHINNVSQQLTKGEKEFALPQWVFAQSCYAFLSPQEIICCYQSKGQSSLAILSLSDRAEPDVAELNDLKTPWQQFSSITADENNITFIAASGETFPQLIAGQLTEDTKTLFNFSVIKSSSQLAVTNDYYSKPQALEFTNRHGKNVFAFYYPPTNPDYPCVEGELPPLIVICHGGPTGQSSTALDPKKQFWTSRGFALLDVNYSGSTGYGRAYRNRLYKNWGILDVEDCCDAALYAVSQSMANRDQLIIRGSSAGGYTVLAALTFEQVFSAGASYYGISELTSLALNTHKFESRYLDRLIGPYPEAIELYQKRSPINYSQQLNCPVVFFQGIDDRVVPKQQAEEMFAALDKKGLTVAAQYYEGEKHGFKKAETIKQSLENELSFYQLVLNLMPKEKIRFKGDIQIKNT